MKAKHFVAASCAALIALAALPLTGCKGTSGSSGSDFERGELDLSKYADELVDSNSADPFTEAVQIGTQLDIVESINGGFIGTVASGKYSVYTGDGVAIETGLTVLPSSYYDSSVGGYLLRTNSNSKYNFYMTDGFKLFSGSNVNKLDILVESKYVGDDSYPSSVWTVSEYGVAGGTTVCYQVTTEDSKTVYTEISADDINNNPPNVSIGGDHYGLAKAVHPNNSLRPVKGEATEYSYADINDTRVFYKDGQETGRIDMYGVDESCFVGNYMYYTTNIMCDKDSGSANLTVVSQYGELKYEYHLNKYDFVNNSHSSYSYNALITGMSALYNKEDKTYDAVSITYMPVKNGVVQSMTQSGKYAVMDCEFRLVGEASTQISSSSLYKLGDDTYGYSSGTYMKVIDKSFTPIASVYRPYSSGSGATYYKTAELFSFVYNDRVGFTGLDGKVKIEPKYTAPSGSGSIKFYGEYAHVKDADTGEELVLKSDGTVTEKPTSTLGNIVTDYNGWYIKETSSSLGIYSLDGTLLKSVSSYDDFVVIDNLVEITDNQGKITALFVK